MGSPPFPPIRGDFVFGPDVAFEKVSGGAILGTRVRFGTDNRPAWIDLQWRDAAGAIHQVEFAFIEALALLSFLKSHQLDAGVPFPDDPRARS